MGKGTSPKREMLLRLSKIAEGLRADGYIDDADALDKVVRSLNTAMGRGASIQEVVLRTMEAIVRGEVTLAGRLVDALAFVGKQYGAVLALHPALLIVAAVGGQDNPDRQDPKRNATLDAVLAALVEDPEPYQESLYTLAVLARTSGLDATAEIATELMEEIHKGGAETMAEQAREIEKRVEARPDVTEEDQLAWVIKLMLTLASIALVAATTTRMVGSIKDVIKDVDGMLSTLLGESE